MNPSQWAKMPRYWQTSPDMHVRIADAQCGHAIGALKLYIGLCVKATFKPKGEQPAGSIRLSLDRLCQAVGISKPTAIAGIRLLVDWGLINNEAGRPATIHIARYNEAGGSWTKLPSAHLYGNSNINLERLVCLQNRGVTRREALQMYLYLASIRDGSSLMQDFLVEDRLISQVGDHLTGSLAEPKATILTRPSSCWQVFGP